jgi:glycosyltransferase involved in cell wall biosynthesis
VAKPKAGVVFGFPMGAGGGLERTVCAVINALNRNEFEVTLVTYASPDTNWLEHMYGYELRIASLWTVGIYYKLPPYIRAPISTLWTLVNLLRVARDLDFVICIGGFLSRFIPYSAKRVVCYQVWPRKNPVPEILANEQQNLPRRIFSILWESVWPAVTGPSRKQFLVTHDSFGAMLLRRDFGLEARHVLGVPAPATPSTYGGQRLNQIVHFARFAPEKRHDLALRIFERLLRDKPDAVLYLVGQANIKGISDAVLQKLEKEISSKSLQKQVKLVESPSHSEIWELLTHSKVIMSMQTEPETYNTTIIEGMAAGCVPLVPNLERGAWDDILERGKFGLGFGSVEEASVGIARILNLKESEFTKYSGNCMRRAQDFSQDVFSKRLVGFVREVRTGKAEDASAAS